MSIIKSAELFFGLNFNFGNNVVCALGAFLRFSVVYDLLTSKSVIIYIVVVTTLFLFLIAALNNKYLTLDFEKILHKFLSRWYLSLILFGKHALTIPSELNTDSTVVLSAGGEWPGLLLGVGSCVVLFYFSLAITLTVADYIYPPAPEEPLSEDQKAGKELGGNEDPIKIPDDDPSEVILEALKEASKHL